MLVYEPTERAAAADLLNHAYVMALSTDNPTSAAASVVGSVAGTVGSSLAGDAGSYAHYTSSNGAAKAGDATGSMDVATGTSTVNTTTGDGGADATGGVEDGLNSKDVLRGRRTDVPATTGKIR